MSAPPVLTERDLLDRLHRRYGTISQGTGARYIRAEHPAGGGSSPSLSEAPPAGSTCPATAARAEAPA